MQTEQRPENAYLGEVLAEQAQVERELKRKARPAAPLSAVVPARARRADAGDEDAATGAPPLGATIAATWRRTSSAAKSGSRSNCPSAQRYAIATFSPSTYPVSFRPR